MLPTIKTAVFGAFNTMLAATISFAKNHYFLAGGAVIIALMTISISARILGKDAAITTETSVPRSVTIALVSDLSQGAETLTTVGTITAQEQATVRAEKGGKVTGVYRKLGDRVNAGTIIAEIDNASERAALLSAQGSVDAANANLNRIKSGSRAEQQTILSANEDTARAGLASAKQSTLNALRSIYAQVDNTIRVTADSMIGNPTTASPDFSVPISNSQLGRDIENMRITMTNLLARQSQGNASLSANMNLNAEIGATEAELKTVLTFLDKIIAALNAAVSSPVLSAATLSGYQTATANARSAIVSSLGTLNSSRESIIAKENALTVAQQNQAQGAAGGDVNDIASAEAAVKQARGSLAQAQATFEKSIIRAPISGTIDSSTLKRGDYIQALSPAISLSNSGNLEIQTYLTEVDAQRIPVGTKATIEGGAEGVVTRKGDGIDPITRKVELRLAVIRGNSTLTAGATTILSFNTGTVQATQAATRLIIPITALRITAEGESVFTVTDNVLIENPVVIGALLGDRVEIKSGIAAETFIVTDARGLRTGQTITVN